MGQQQLHARISPQRDYRLVPMIRLKDPNARSRWSSHHHHNRRSHRYDFQSLQISVHFLVLEGGRSPPPSTQGVCHLQCRWPPGGWCESVSFYLFLCFLGFVGSYVSIQVFLTFWLMFDQTMLILLKHIFIRWFWKLTSVLERRLDPFPPPPWRSEPKFALIHTNMIPPMKATSINLFVCAFETFGK